MAWSGSSLESSLSDASSRQLSSPLCRKTPLVSGLLPVSGGPRGGSAGSFLGSCLSLGVHAAALLGPVYPLQH